LVFVRVGVMEAEKIKVRKKGNEVSREEGGNSGQK
jgi:hypothetical protein